MHVIVYRQASQFVRRLRHSASLAELGAREFELTDIGTSTASYNQVRTPPGRSRYAN